MELTSLMFKNLDFNITLLDSFVNVSIPSMLQFFKLAFMVFDDIFLNLSILAKEASSKAKNEKLLIFFN